MKVTKRKIVDVLPPCTQSGCTTPARFSLVWAREVAYCPKHTVLVLNVADAMGFITPAETITGLIAKDEDATAAFAAIIADLNPDQPPADV
jgi:hypothetical protein